MTNQMQDVTSHPAVTADCDLKLHNSAQAEMEVHMVQTEYPVHIA